jgi:hypothetical protein
MLVRLIVSFDHEIALTITLVIAVVARLLLHHPLLLFAYKLILPKKRRRLFLNIALSISKLNLIYFCQNILGRFVYT